MQNDERGCMDRVRRVIQPRIYIVLWVEENHYQIVSASATTTIPGLEEVFTFIQIGRHTNLGWLGLACLLVVLLYVRAFVQVVVQIKKVGVTRSHHALCLGW
jgi:hypothetical protein